MSKPFYSWTRDLHLYFGLLISPFVAVFSVTVFYLNHARLPSSPPSAPAAVFRNLEIPAGIETAEGIDRVRLASRVLEQVGVAGEINFIRAFPKQRRLLIPVVKPGAEATIDLNLETGTAEVSGRRTTLWESLSYLHRLPGPHNAAIRGNWVWTRVWQWLADATVYLVLFLSLSGLYLWVVIRSERMIGLILLLAGAISFAGIVYVVIA